MSWLRKIWTWVGLAALFAFIAAWQRHLRLRSEWRERKRNVTIKIDKAKEEIVDQQDIDDAYALAEYHERQAFRREKLHSGSSAAEINKVFLLEGIRGHREQK